jgi:hypothetical protein
LLKHFSALLLSRDGQIRTAADSQFGATNVIEIPLDPPYRKVAEPKLNEFGIPEKPFSRTADVAKILRISPSALQWRFRKGWYLEMGKTAPDAIYSKEKIF